MRESKQGIGRAMIDSPPPAEGEVIRRAIPDTFDGIRFEIGRMVRYVKDGRSDPVVIDTARVAAGLYADFVEEMSARDGRPVQVHNNKTIHAEGLDIWCRENFRYLNDPTGVEVIQTPSRMVRQARTPREVLVELMEPYYRAMESADPGFDRSSYEPKSAYYGDCDEAVCMFLALCAAIDVGPCKFRFGGNGGTLHHVWGLVEADGVWYDCDLTEPGYKLGDFTEFEHYEELDIPL